MDSMAVFNGGDHRTFLRGKGRKISGKQETLKPDTLLVSLMAEVLYEGNLRFTFGGPGCSTVARL